MTLDEQIAEVQLEIRRVSDECRTAEQGLIDLRDRYRQDLTSASLTHDYARARAFRAQDKMLELLKRRGTQKCVKTKKVKK